MGPTTVILFLLRCAMVASSKPRWALTSSGGVRASHYISVSYGSPQKYTDLVPSKCARTCDEKWLAGMGEYDIPIVALAYCPI